MRRLTGVALYGAIGCRSLCSPYAFFSRSARK